MVVEMLITKFEENFFSTPKYQNVNIRLKIVDKTEA